MSEGDRADRRESIKLGKAAMSAEAKAASGKKQSQTKLAKRTKLPLSNAEKQRNCRARKAAKKAGELS